MKTRSRLQPCRALLAAAFALLAATAAPARHAAAADLTVDGAQTFPISADATYGTVYDGYNSQGTINQSGGNVTATNRILVGLNSGSSGAYNLSGGTLSESGEMDIGLNGTGTFVQSGSSTFTVNGSIYLGSQSGGVGTYTLSNTATVSAVALAVGPRNAPGSTFNQNGGTVTLSSVVYLAGISGANATYNLNAGTLTASAVTGSAYGTSTFNFNGGTVQPTGSSTTFISAVTNLNVQAGGFVIDTAGRANTVAQPLLHASGGTADGGVSVNGTGSIQLSGTNTYTGATTVNTGELRFGDNATANSSTINLGGTGGMLPATVTLASTTASTLNSPMTVRSGSSGLNTLRNDANSANGLNYAGAITLNKDLTVATASPSTSSTGNAMTISGTITANATQSGTPILNIGDGTTANKGTVTLGGNTDNPSLSVAVNSGTLLLGKTSSGTVHAVGGILTVANGATLQLGGSGGDQIGSGVPVTINAGGTFKTGGLSEGGFSTGFPQTGFAFLTLAGTSTVDFGNGNTTIGSSLFPNRGGISGNGTIRILNWTGTPGVDLGADANDRLLFSTDPGFSAARLAQFQFSNDAGVNYTAGAQIISYRGYPELVPALVPEPGTWALVCAGAGLLGLSVHRRRAARA